MKQGSNFFITTAIPYVNAKPHLGHALLFTYGDVLARYRRLEGDRVIFSIGTDEHGAKVAEKALEAGRPEQAFVDEMSAEFKGLAAKLGISYDRFIRTTDEDHCRRAQSVWQRLQAYIYKGFYEGWYCRGCEDYKTETVVKATEGRCPDHDRDYEKIKEENYFFKLSAFAGRIREEIESGRLRIVPEAARAETLGWLDQGLEDISFSRPAANLSWGIEVPGDPSHVMYVWCDALSNYITVLGYPDGRDFAAFWPADVQVIGRDILRFHALIWPGILLGLGLPVQRQLYVHGLVTVEGRKMSKTLGNVVEPLELVADYGLDAFRYFFLRHQPAYDNGDFSYRRFIDAYNNELVDQLGNLVRRLQTLAWQKAAGRLPKRAVPAWSQANLEPDSRRHFADCRFDQAFHLGFAEVKALNRLLERKKPWELEPAEAVPVLDQAVATLAGVCRLLTPFLPDLSARIEEIFAHSEVSPVEKPLLGKIDDAG